MIQGGELEVHRDALRPNSDRKSLEAKEVRKDVQNPSQSPDRPERSKKNPASIIIALAVRSVQQLLARLLTAEATWSWRYF